MSFRIATGTLIIKIVFTKMALSVESCLAHVTGAFWFLVCFYSSILVCMGSCGSCTNALTGLTHCVENLDSEPLHCCEHYGDFAKAGYLAALEYEVCRPVADCQ